MKYGYGITLLIAISVACSGCAIPALTGLKHVKTASGTEYSFITGADIGFSLNGIDRVHNERGIKPEGAK